MNEIIKNLNDALTKIKALSYLGYNIPNELIMKSTQLMCDYNEALKKESNGK